MWYRSPGGGAPPGSSLLFGAISVAAAYTAVAPVAYRPTRKVATTLTACSLLCQGCDKRRRRQHRHTP